MSRCDRGLVSDQGSTGTGKIGKGELQWSREGTGEQGVQRRQESPGNRLLAREPVKAEDLDSSGQPPADLPSQLHLGCRPIEKFP